MWNEKEKGLFCGDTMKSRYRMEEFEQKNTMESPHEMNEAILHGTGETQYIPVGYIMEFDI